jgi:selenoprotein W-related protein
LAEYILTSNKQQVQGLTLVPYDDGRFEVVVNGTKIYSKLETGVFPDNREIQAALEKQAA